MVEECRINDLILKCIHRNYKIETAQRYLRRYCKINLSNEVLGARHKLLLKLQTQL